MLIRVPFAVVTQKRHTVSAWVIVMLGDVRK